MSKVTIIDFRASYCWPCRMMLNVFKEFEEKHPEVEVQKINIEEDNKLASEIWITSIPHIIVFKDGVEVETIKWVVSLDKLEEFLD